jgi:hypothetical protein
VYNQVLSEQAWKERFRILRLAPEPLPTPVLIKPVGGTSFSVQNPIEFKWEKSELADDQRYVFIIQDDGNYCEGSNQCFDVHWIVKGKSTYTLSKGRTYFLRTNGGSIDVDENTLEWKVVVSTTGDANFKPTEQDTNIQPASTVVQSEVRKFTLRRKR